MPVVIAVHGPSGSGKTTLIERVIPRLTARGLKVGVIKHAHDGVQLDGEGKDSWRMWQAGVQTVLVASPREVFTRERRSWSTLRELLDLLPQELDCVLIEGFTHTVTAVDVPVSVAIELTPAGVRLNGQLLYCGDVAAAVEAAVMKRFKLLCRKARLPASRVTRSRGPHRPAADGAGSVRRGEDRWGGAAAGPAKPGFRQSRFKPSQTLAESGGYPHERP